MLEPRVGLDSMVDRAREMPAVFANKFLIEGMGDAIKITFGEAALTPDDIAQGLTLESVFRARVAVAMPVNELLSLRDVLNRMYEDVYQPTQPPV